MTNSLPDPSDDPLPAPADAAAVRQALTRILESDEFEGASRIQSFLSYVVEETLEGRGSQIRAKTIAMDVYGRAPEQGEDTLAVVRVDAGRLRRRLSVYYAQSGQNDPLRIEILPGGYAPSFSPNAPEPATPAAHVAAPVLSSQGKRMVVDVRWLVAVVALVVLGGLAAWQWTPAPQLALPVQSQTDPNSTLRETLFSTSPQRLQAENLARQARELMFPAIDRKRLQAVSLLFERVIELDDAYYAGYAGSAQAAGILALITPPGAEHDALQEKTISAADQAIDLAPDQGLSHSAMMMAAFLQKDCGRVETQAAMAARLSPDDGQIRTLSAMMFLFCGQFQDTIDHLKTDGTNSSVAGAAMYHLGDYQGTIDNIIGAAADGNPTSAVPMTYLASAYAQLGQDDKARETVRLLNNAWPDLRIDALFHALFLEEAHANQVVSPLNQF